MKYRKRIYGALLICALLVGFSAKKAYAQYMPVVYDRTYGENVNYQHIHSAPGGEVVLVGTNNEKTTVTWVKRAGEILFSRTISTSFVSVNNVYGVGDNKILIIGQGSVKLKGKKNPNLIGRAAIVDKKGDVLAEAEIGDNGSELFCGKVLRNGSFILGGYELRANGTRAGMIGKVDPSGKVVYKYVSSESGPCVAFDALGSATEYVHAAFTGEDEESLASVVRLDSKGQLAFATVIPNEGFNVQKMITASDDHIFLIGNSEISGGRVLKLRSEGDIVFNKEIVPASEQSTLEHLYLAKNGNILVGGNGGERSYYSLLRNDGTDLQKYILRGSISGMGMDENTGESVIVGFDTDRNRGTIIGLAKDGRQIYQKSTDGNFNKAQLSPAGIFLASTSTGRVCMVSNMGDVMFDRYAVEDSQDESEFDNILFTSNGDIIFKGIDNRVVKLGHGVYVSDVKINKPVNGYTTAFFTVTLTGYSTNDLGVPVPVTVEYLTKQGSATEANNYTPVKGSLSFVPSNDGASRYMIKQDVEVPIKANNLMEGRKEFEMHLANISQSYLVKPIGIGTIEDQEVLVKFVNSENGLEGERDVVYELGIFKTNGEALVNATGSDIVIDGVYGKGTADALDYDTGVIPRLVIAKGAKTGRFNVKTLNDTRYELPKTVVLDFSKIHTINDANIAFESTMLSCTGTIIDQPAMIAISSLGDHGRMNNIVSGFYKISLLRASDGALLANATGGDVVVTCSVAPETTAIEGKDFVLTNLHDLRIWGDGNRSTVNLNGIVLFDKDKLGAKSMVMEINSVKTPDFAPEVRISTTGKAASFMIHE